MVRVVWRCVYAAGSRTKQLTTVEKEDARA
jgi:hypothetical protein